MNTDVYLHFSSAHLELKDNGAKLPGRAEKRHDNEKVIICSCPPPHFHQKAQLTLIGLTTGLLMKRRIIALRIVLIWNWSQTQGLCMTQGGSFTYISPNQKYSICHGSISRI